MPSMQVDPKSVASLCLVPYAFSRAIGQGTGFVVRVDDVYLLITNYHVVSGRHPDSHEPLDTTGHLPDRLLIPMLRNQKGELSWRPHVQQTLWEGNGLWVEHPRLGSRFDVVALPLEIPDMVHVVSYDREPGPLLNVGPGSDIAIIGFPVGMSAAGLTALWKAGTVASEVEATLHDRNYFWVDSNSRQGMSGSPVIARRFGGALMETGDYSLGSGVIDRTLGVYAGRAFEAVDMTLGRVWGWDGVQQVIDEAVERVRNKTIRPMTANIGLYQKEEELMVKLDGGIKVTVTFRLPDGRVLQEERNLKHVFDELILSDPRFGKSLALVKASAVIEAAVAAGVAEGKPILLDDDGFNLACEVLQSPALGFNPVAARQMMPLFEHILNARKIEQALQ